MKTHQLGALGHSYKIVEAPKEDFFGEQSGTKIVLHLREEAQERHPCGRPWHALAIHRIWFFFFFYGEIWEDGD